MDQSYSESDVSLSPSQILERLHMLRQWQLLQRGKLQKQQLQYHETSEITSSITELVSHFSNTTSYNTFRSLLQSPQENTSEISPQVHTNNLSRKANLHNVIDGISILNLSAESQCINNSPISTRSTSSANLEVRKERSSLLPEAQAKKQISLDDMPILSPKKDFETLIADKLKNETTAEISTVIVQKQRSTLKKPFLKKGQGTARYGLKKNDFIVQNTKSLPWRKNIVLRKNILSRKEITKSKESKENLNVPVQIMVDGPKVSPIIKCDSPNLKSKSLSKVIKFNTNDDNQQMVVTKEQDEISSNLKPVFKNPSDTISLPPEKHPLCTTKEKTWAALFTKEQDDFLRKLKQTAYYKTFASPAKSAVSDLSSDEQQFNLRQKREESEQNMFEIIENKVSHESFAIDNSFFSRFIQKNDLECSGESTPLILQKCLKKNPNLMHIHPDIIQAKRADHLCSDAETCESECTECIDNYSSVSSCCSCKSLSHSNITCIQEDKNKEQDFMKKVEQSKKIEAYKINKKCHNDNVTQENEGSMSVNIADMNSKLLATSELLKERLQELEEEIETFRKENANLSKMRDNIDFERQKFLEEKTRFEQKFNEEKILSEYYMAEEKEKLNKQKQMYERYVRDIRGRLNKKEKDEIMNLKKEIQCLKEEIRIKDAKSTSTIARLRNQIKIMEKDKKNLEVEVEKCKKENKRLHHSNEITRRLSNLQYLEQINKKLTNMAKDTKSEVKLDSDVKYRSYEIERQSRSRKVLPFAKGTTRPRAKSVPNLNVISRYAKYFSQKDTLSDREKNKTVDNDNFQILTCNFEDEQLTSDNEINLDVTTTNINNSDSEEDNHLEKIYNERFKSLSPNSKMSSSSTSVTGTEFLNNDVQNSNFFITKVTPGSKETSSSRGLLPSFGQTSYNIKSTPSSITSISSNTNTSKQLRNDQSSITVLKNQQDYNSDSHVSINGRTKSPVSILSNRALSSQKSNTVIHKETLCDVRMIPSPELTSSKINLIKTNLNPIEIRKPDGTKELKFPNGNIKIISSDGKYSKFMYYNGDIKENFYNEGRIKYYYAETKTIHTTHPDGLEVLEFPDGQVEKRYKDGSSEIRLPNGSVRYFDPKNDHVREEWRFPDGAALTVSVNGEQRIVFPNGQIEVHTQDHKRREFPDGTVKLVYNDGTSETRYASGRVRIKDKHGNLIMDSAS